MDLFRKLMRRAQNFGLSRQVGRRFLLKYVERGDVGAEIGVWKGDFSKMILGNRQLKKYYLIDPYEFMPQFPNRMYGGKVAKSQDDMDDMFDQVRTDLSRYPAEKAFLRKRSDEAVNDIADGELDFLYIDGNHYYDGVMSDLRSYHSKVRVGGFLMLDDWLWRDDEGVKSVEKAALDFLGDHAGDFQFLEISSGQAVIVRVR